jgi:hypothetical protein
MVGLIGMFAWQLALAILPASAWLTCCRTIVVLRRRVGFAYGIAFALVVSSCLLSHNGLSPLGLGAGAIALLILYASWRSAVKSRSMEVSTIISYSHHGDAS